MKVVCIGFFNLLFDTNKAYLSLLCNFHNCFGVCLFYYVYFKKNTYSISAECIGPIYFICKYPLVEDNFFIADKYIIRPAR